MQSYQTEALPLWHVDLYRIASPDEILELGLEEAEEGALFLEWPERMGRALPAARLHIRFTIEKDERRGRSHHGMEQRLGGAPWASRTRL